MLLWERFQPKHPGVRGSQVFVLFLRKASGERIAQLGFPRNFAFAATRIDFKFFLNILCERLGPKFE